VIKSIPVTILTGFLGAGKTTFLKDWLHAFGDQKWAVIENEWGQENVDAAWVTSEKQPVFQLTQGCICCTLHEQFYTVLGQIHEQAENWDGLLIETTGVADPAGVLSPFLVTPALKDAFPLARVICLVDPDLWQARVNTSTELRRQAAYASVFVLTKADQASPDVQHQVAAELHALFPDVPVFLGEKGKFPFPEIIAHQAYEIPCAIQNFESREHHTAHISSITLRFDRPFSLQTLRWRLAGFLTFQAQDVWRLKGWVMDEVGQVWALQSVGNQMTLTLSAQAATGSVIVLIGNQLKRPGYEKFFKTCLVP